MTGARGLALLALALFGGIVAFGWELQRAHDESEDAAIRRFEQRAQISAAAAQSVFGALGDSSSTQLGEKLNGSSSEVRRYLREAFAEARTIGYAAVLDPRGAIVARTGSVPVRPGLRPRGVLLSDVRPTRRGAVVEYVLSIPGGGGSRGAGGETTARTLVEGVRLAFMREFLTDYFRRLPNPDGTLLVISDRAGRDLLRLAPAGHSKDAHGARTIRVAAPVPGTTWRLSLVGHRDRVLAGAKRGAWVAWAVLALLAVAICAGLWLGARAVRASGRIRRTNVALRESETKMRGLVDALEEAVVLQYADGRVELLNASAREMFAGFERDFPFTLARGHAERRIVALERPDAPRRWLEVSARPLMRVGEGEPYAVVCSCGDVTDREELEAHLLDLADRDPLTGLWNRRRFEQDVALQLDRCRRYDERAAVVLMDVDGFKHVNDVLGHLAGDEVLRALGDQLRERLRSSDRAARLGGDEFAALLLDVDEAQAARIACDLASRLADAACAVQDRVELSISVGVGALRGSTGGVREALDAADHAMYAAKQERGAQRLVSDGADAQPAEMASLRALLAAVNARDSYTATHSRQVVTLARAVARRLELDDAQIAEVEHVALLHDLGKIAVPDSILRKNGPLTDHERTLMRQHPVVGAEILASMPELAHLAPAVRAEHERWDGKGYPDGLRRDEIPIASRIALVCDAYHAMTSHRPYRPALSPQAARDEILRHAGSQFCPRASEALLAVLFAPAGAPA